MGAWFPEPASSFAGNLDRLIAEITVLVGGWFLAAEAVLFYFLFRYRRREEAPRPPARERLAWVLIPAALVLACDLAIDAAGAPVWREIKEEIPPADLTVGVRGRQYLWEFTHPGEDGELGTEDDVLLLNELHVPRNAVVRFSLTAEDVLHSLWMPHLRLKQDAVPGRAITGWFQAVREGEFPVACAELCGIGHGAMKGRLVVHSPEGYRRWTVEKPWTRE